MTMAVRNKRRLFLNLVPLFFLLPPLFLLFTTLPAGNLHFIANLKPPTSTTSISSSLPLPAALASLWDYSSSDEDPADATPGGEWTLLQASLGVSAMHMQLLHDDTVVIFDRTSANCADGGSFLDLEGLNCSVHSVLYEVASNTFRPLNVQTDTFCSSGSVDPHGVLIQTGGYSTGERVIRTFYPCERRSACDWKELPVLLSARRWYSSNHLLPDGRIIIVGGRNSPSYEFFPPADPPTIFRLPFLQQTWDGRNNENNLYPFLHLLPDGNLFIFANNRSIAFDYRRNQVIREFPPMPGDDRRCYPSTGSSVLLPLMLSGEDESPELEVMICGGAPGGAYYLAEEGKLFVEASRTCGRLKITDSNPRWLMEEMPMPRVMGDMILLPTGDVLIINGAGNGTAGWDNADNPVLHPVLYRTYEPDPDRRFAVMKPTAIPRMYHSSAILAADGRVLVAGSNPNPEYTFIGARFPTELRLETYAPHYLDPTHALLRPSILTVESQGSEVTYGQIFAVTYDLSEYRAEEEGQVAVTMLFPPFTTHSFGMNQRMVIPRVERVDQLSVRTYKVTVRAPGSPNVGPPGYYLLFLVHAGTPSRGVWVKLVAQGINDNFSS